MDIKKRILDAVLQEFNEKGMKFTMDDIARRLHISKKTIYKTYENKEQLFYAMVDEGFNEIKRAENVIYDDTSMDIVTKISKILIALPESYRSVDFGKLRQLKDDYPEIYRYVEERIETGWDKTIELINEGMDQGYIRRIPVPVMKAMVEATIEEFVGSGILTESGIGYEEALDEMIDILMNGIALKQTGKD